MLHENQKSGHRDVDGNWIDETPAAKLRNKLSPFWTLSTMLTDEVMVEKFFGTEEGKKLLQDIAKTCEDNKKLIIDLIDELAKNF